MAIKIQTINEAVKDNGLKILVHGPAGAGKTVLCASAGKKTLIISAESGLLSIKGAIETGLLPEIVNDLVDIVEIKTIVELKEIYMMLSEQSPKVYEWIALDSISEIAEVVLSDAKDECKDPRQAYGVLSEEMSKILRKFRDLPEYNVIMSCKQQRVVDSEADRTMYMPALPGAKLAQSIPYLFDEVFAIRIEQDEEGGNYRTLQTNRDIHYEAKDRSGKLDTFEEVSLYHIEKKIRAVIRQEDPIPDPLTDEQYEKELKSDEDFHREEAEALRRKEEKMTDCVVLDILNAPAERLPVIAQETEDTAEENLADNQI